MHFETQGAEVERLEEDVLYVKWLEGGLNLENAKYTLEKIKEAFGEGPFLMLPDTRAFKSMPKPIRDYFNSQEFVDMVDACAILVDNGISRTIANMALMFMKPKYPTKLFLDKQKALDWLLAYKAKTNHSA